LEVCPGLSLDLLILDLKLERLYGLELAEALLAGIPGLRILAYSGEVNAYNLRTIESLGILGYLDKSDPVMADDAYFVDAIRRVASGKRVYSPTIESLRKELSSDPDAFHRILSPKKIEILKFIGLCLNDEEIAGKTGLSVHTIRKHRTEIMQQLGLESTHQLIRYAQKNGFCNQTLEGELE
jgi:DNA-binding NarL/FixJ family response regulator